MHTFKDNAGREWKLRLSGSAIRRLKHQLNFDAREWTTGRAAVDVPLVVNAIYLLCEEQAKQRGINDVEFGQSVVGCIEDAVDAFLQELVGYMPQKIRPELIRVMNEGQNDG